MDIQSSWQSMTLASCTFFHSRLPVVTFLLSCIKNCNCCLLANLTFLFYSTALSKIGSMNKLSITSLEELVSNSAKICVWNHDVHAKIRSSTYFIHAGHTFRTILKVTLTSMPTNFSLGIHGYLSKT